MLGGHVTGGENVGKENKLFVGQVLGHLLAVHIGIRNSQIFRLTSGVTTREMRITKNARRCLTEGRFTNMGFGVCVVAAAVEFALAEET